jgi:hypothetical protein
VPDAGATRPPGNALALGCGGFVSFFAAAFVVGVLAAQIQWGVLVPLAIAVALLVRGVRRATPAGRTDLARFAVGFAAAAVLFGGCLVLISNADFR